MDRLRGYAKALSPLARQLQNPDVCRTVAVTTDGAGGGGGDGGGDGTPMTCSSDDVCPAGQVCRNGVCVPDGTGGGGEPPVDGSPPPGLQVPDVAAIPEAALDALEQAGVIDLLRDLGLVNGNGGGGSASPYRTRQTAEAVGIAAVRFNGVAPPLPAGGVGSLQVDVDVDRTAANTSPNMRVAIDAAGVPAAAAAVVEQPGGTVTVNVPTFEVPPSSFEVCAAVTEQGLPDR